MVSAAFRGLHPPLGCSQCDGNTRFASQASALTNPSMSVYYPVFPLDHPVMKRMEELEQKYGKMEKVPENERGTFPPFEGSIILVKTDDFDRIQNIPKHVIFGRFLIFEFLGSQC